MKTVIIAIDTICGLLIAFVVLAILGVFAGCESPEGFSIEPIPQCDTLRTVYFVSDCYDGTVKCDLKSTASADATATGCMMVVVNSVDGTVIQRECVKECK